MTDVPDTQGDEIAGFRLSPQQRAVWRMRQGDAAGEALVQCALVARGGSIDATRLCMALQSLVDRHEILRTSFKRLPGSGVPVQVIADAWAVPVIDLRRPAADAATRAAVIEELLEAARSECLEPPQGDREPALFPPVDVEAEPSLRATLVRFGPGEGAMLLTLSALCTDAAGMVNVARELAHACAEENPAGDVLQYADLAEWQNELLEQSQQPTARVRTAAPELALARAGGERFAPQRVRAPLDSELLARIESVARAHATDANTVVLAGFGALLARLGGADVTLGVAGEGRGYEGLDRALGAFARDLPVAIASDGAVSFGELVEATHRALAGQLEQQEAFALERVANAGSASFDLGFAAEDWSLALSEAGAAFAIEGHWTCNQRCLLRLVVARETSGAVLELYHDAGRVERADAERLLAQLRLLLGAATQDPQTRVAELDLLSDAERRRVLVDWNAATAPVPDGCIHGLIAAHARTQPQAIAVACGGATLTYAALDRRAAQIAQHLRAAGVAPGVLVGVCTPRSLDMIAAIAGVLQAGGAYVPLDPSYPKARLQLMLEDAAMPVVLTTNAVRSALPESGARVLSLDSLPDGADAKTAGRAAQPSDVAYVIYTSGSTGKPKGVEITHRNLQHSTAVRAPVYGAPPRCYLLLSSFAFDSSVPGIFWTLASGGTLVLPEEGKERDLHEITALIRRHRVTHTLALPSLYAVMLRETRGQGLESLDTVIVAGEACPRELVELHGEVLPRARLFNEYGPTENSVWSTVHRCVPGQSGRRVPIGKPVPNVRAYVLDPARRPLPIGVAGELYVGGLGIARGYLRRPELTAERFVADPFVDSSVPGERLYRTGDLVRWLADGDLEFLGRVDNQVKIRGYRIELEEIEGVLAAAPGIAEAAVIARDEPGGKSLAAFVVAQAGASPTPAAMAEWLGARLPEYMVPATFAVLDDLPRMPNGKVDRNALETLQASRSAARAEYTAPRNPVEEVLARVWSELLGVELIGVHDNFFRLGGHSLLVTQLIFRLREVFRAEISLRAIFDRPSIAELGELLLSDESRRAHHEAAATAWLAATPSAR